MLQRCFDGARHEDPSRLARRAAREGRHPWRADCECPLEEPAPEIIERPRGVRQAGALFPMLLLRPCGRGAARLGDPLARDLGFLAVP